MALYLNGVSVSGKMLFSHVPSEIVYEIGTLLHTLDNPNAFGTSANDSFGEERAVSIHGNHAIVGAFLEDETGFDGDASGKAYIFDVTTGALLHTLSNPNAFGTTRGDAFGGPVAIFGNYAVVGAWSEDDSNNLGSGRAYIFDVTTGARLFTINNPLASNTSTRTAQFGQAIAMSGNLVLIGAPAELDGGKAFIFDVTTGALLHTLNNPNAFGTVAGDAFGSVVAISGNLAIVSAPFEDDTSVSTSGRVYIFDATTGALLRTLDNPNPAGTKNNDRFGEAIAISGNYIVAGAPFEVVDGFSFAGRAYIFNATTGALLFTLNNPNAFGANPGGDQFGRRLAMSGNKVVIGAYFEDDAGGVDSGKAYMYDVTTGTLLHTFHNPNAFSTSGVDNFGKGIAMTGDRVIISAPAEGDASGTNSGKAYIFAI